MEKRDTGQMNPDKKISFPKLAAQHSLLELTALDNCILTLLSHLRKFVLIRCQRRRQPSFVGFLGCIRSTIALHRRRNAEAKVNTALLLTSLG